MARGSEGRWPLRVGQPHVEQADLAEFVPPARRVWRRGGNFAHVPGAVRIARLYPLLVDCLQPGGLLLEAYSLAQLPQQAGQKTRILLMSVDAIRCGFAGLGLCCKS